MIVKNRWAPRRSGWLLLLLWSAGLRGIRDALAFSPHIPPAVPGLPVLWRSNGLSRPAEKRSSLYYNPHSSSSSTRNRRITPQKAGMGSLPGLVGNLLASTVHRLGSFRTPTFLRVAATTLVVVLTTLLYQHRYRYLWPGLDPDPHYREPIPPGVLGCPLLGNNFLVGDRRRGPEYFYRRASRKLGDPRVWRMYAFGTPVAVVSGKSLVQHVNNLEFNKTAPGSTEYASSPTDRTEDPDRPRLFGTSNVMFEADRDRHQLLRRLVGSAMTPAALKEALPTMQQTATTIVQQKVVDLLYSTKNHTTSNIKMEDVSVAFTLAIVQNQLLGLTNIPPDEVEVFRKRLQEWTTAFFSMAGILPFPWLVKRTKAYRAKVYIQQKIQDKIESLLASGPDTSTLSRMLFAADDDNDNGNQTSAVQLARDEVVENALLLVLAGAETSAGTLTLALFLLGLHPEVYLRLVQEQQNIMEQHGETLTPEILDQQCPYLEAVLKETLRVGPVTGGFLRTVQETFVVDGFQIPRGWNVFTTYRLTHELDPTTARPDDAHMDPRMGFQPDRWLDPATLPQDYLPFGTGPRFCLGYHLALMEMKVFLAELARQVPAYRLTHYAATTTTTTTSSSSSSSAGAGAGAGDENKPIVWNPRTIIPRPLDGVMIEAIEQRTSSFETR